MRTLRRVRMFSVRYPATRGPAQCTFAERKTGRRMQQQVQTAAGGALMSTARPGALIIGASTGMGAALARVLAARGYAVGLIGRQSDKLAQLAQEINGGGKGQ